MIGRSFLIQTAFSAVLISSPIGARKPMQSPVIPKPKKMEMKAGHFTLNKETRIVLSGNGQTLQSTAELLALKLRTATGYPFQIVFSDEKNPKNAIKLSVEGDGDEFGKEGYELTVKEKNITITGGAAAGSFYGVQTLYQLLPPEVEKGELATGVDWQAPCLKIKDQPRFRWRGMHLDVGRHFFPKEFIKKYIDLLASYKMNTFHWHLTEDQGWRLEIKQYPRLTKVGGWRKQTMEDNTAHGGFYTQDEVREVVEYAKERFITIVPEIEMPGHSLAALASYPELSCSGGPFKVGTEWGVFNDVYCAGNETTFDFLENVIEEVTRLFPGPFFHIGGDECPKLRWSNCVRCQNRIKAEGLKDEHELQSYFIRRIEKILNARGKRLVGWDEILEGGLAPNATVMSWRGVQGGIDAAKSGHDVVMTPTSHCYFDYFQGVIGEPKAIGGFLPIDTVYSFEPVPAALSEDEAKHVLGAQGNVWTEWMPTTRQVEYMVLPRLCAMSEVVWSEKEQRNSQDFLKRLEEHYDRFVARDFSFRVPTPVGLGGKKVIYRDTLVEMKNPVSAAVIYYTLDGQDPTIESRRYSKPIGITGDQTLKAVLVLASGRISNPVTTQFFRVDPEVNGLNYSYYEGEWEQLPDFRNLTRLKSGRAYLIGLDEVPHRPERFGLQLSGLIAIDQEGEYSFYLTSDDGSKLFIDEREVVNNDGLHGAYEASGKIFLTKGKHGIAVHYFQRGGDRVLDASIEGPQLEKQTIHPRTLTIQ